MKNHKLVAVSLRRRLASEVERPQRTEYIYIYIWAPTSWNEQECKVGCPLIVSKAIKNMDQLSDDQDTGNFNNNEKKGNH